MRKISFMIVLLAVVMFAAAPVMAQSEVIYDNDTTTAPSGGPETSTDHVGPAYFNASAFHAGMSGVPYTSWGYTSGNDPLGSYSIIGLFVSSGGSGIGAASLAPAYSTPCPSFADTNGYNVNGGCGANKYAFDWGMGNAFGTPRTVGNNGHTIVDDMLAKMITGADTFGTDQADYLIQQVEVMFMRDYITNVDLMNAPAINQFPHTMSSDMWSLFVDQTIDQDLAWSDGGDSSSFLLSPNPNTPDLKAGQAIRGILSQRFQIGSTSGYTMLGFRTFAAWDPQTQTVQLYSCGAAAGGLCSDANATQAVGGRPVYGGGNGNDHAISQWVASFVKDSDGSEGIVSSISSWYMRENNFKDCPTPFPGVALNSSGTQVDRQGNVTNPLSAEDTSLHGNAGVGGPCSFTYGAPGPFQHFIPEIDNHPAGGFVPDP